jgi:AraC family transcriptional regulator
VLDVALGVGFNSTEAFARAFRTRFHCTPTAWRKSKHDQVARKSGQAPRFDRRKTGGPSKQETTMKVKIVDRPPVHVAYLRYTGPVGPAISRFWMEKVAPWMETNNLMGRERFGISLDDPSVTKSSACRYDACVESPESEALTGDPQRKVIPGGRYAALAFEGTSAEIPAAWDALLRDWLPASGMQLDARPFFEHYPVDGRYDPKTGAFSCNICVPVSPL